MATGQLGLARVTLRRMQHQREKVSNWKLQLGTLVVLLAALLEIAGIGALIVGTLCMTLFWLDVRHGPGQGEPVIFALVGVLLLPFGVIAFLAGFLTRRWLTPRLHRDAAA